MRTFARSIFTAALLCAACTAFGAGGGSMPSTPSYETRTPRSPEEQARILHNDGVRAVERADELAADAARQTDPRKREKTRGKSLQSYVSALRKFTRATT